MRVEEASSIIRVLTAAYPTYPVGDDTSSLYVEALVTRDAEAALAAARTWVMTQPHFPRISELLSAIRAETPRAPITELPAHEGPRLTREELRAMRPTNLPPQGARHGHGTHRSSRRPGAASAG